jgi:hypothetical protein
MPERMILEVTEMPTIYVDDRDPFYGMADWDLTEISVICARTAAALDAWSVAYANQIAMLAPELIAALDAIRAIMEDHG